MMKLFFGLMDKINRPLHIIDLSFSPLRRKRDVTKPVRWTENEGTTMRAFRKRGRYHKEKECCRRAEEEEEEEEDDDDDDEETTRKKGHGGEESFWIERRHHFFPLFSSLFFLTKRHAFSKAKQSD